MNNSVPDIAGRDLGHPSLTSGQRDVLYALPFGEGESVSIAEVARRASSSGQTALLRLEKLEKLGLVERSVVGGFRRIATPIR